MIDKVVIEDNGRSPFYYLPELRRSFPNGRKFIFSPGVNVIVGENGSGKTTLLNLIRKYLLVSYQECDYRLYRDIAPRFESGGEKIPTGVGVYADYTKNVFRMCHMEENPREREETPLHSFEEFTTLTEQPNISTGEGIKISLSRLFHRMFSTDVDLRFPLENIKRETGDVRNAYLDYVEKHKVSTADEYTVLLDEPDRNLDVDSIGEMKGVLGVHKEQTQLIVTIHNPLLIYWASEQPNINVIEMSDGYVRKVKSFIERMVGQPLRKKM